LRGGFAYFPKGYQVFLGGPLNFSEDYQVRCHPPPACRDDDFTTKDANGTKTHEGGFLGNVGIFSKSIRLLATALVEIRMTNDE